MKEVMNFKELPDPSNRYVLEECMGTGVYGKVFRAKDTQAEGKHVAIKTQRFNEENVPFIQEEYTILRDFSTHPNLPEFYGIYKASGDDGETIWFVMELCEGGPVTDLVNGLMTNHRRIPEEHVAFILKEVVKVLVYLHENKIMHRDIKGSNILLTKNGEIKLVDFGLSRLLKSTLGKTNSCLGCPNWMAPEVISSQGSDNDGYDNRADVWSVGIVALEIANGKLPFQGMHPTRTLFQIARNPPPTLDRPDDWAETFNDFINECLVKNPEHRPYMMELLEHPFLTEVPENNYYLTQEVKVLSQQFSETGKGNRVSESVVHSNMLKKRENELLEQMLVEDLATLDEVNEDRILEELQNRMAIGQFCTFIGDILLVLNPNEQQDIYGEEQHRRYQFKSRSDHAPHIYSVADSAYQAALHHEITQHILLAGESASGKTTNYLHIVDHLLFLGQNNNINQDRIKNAIKLIHAFIHASTPTNDYSTRGAFHSEIVFGNSGRNTGARFVVHQIEKWRVSSTDMAQSNFHMLYYFYDGIQASGELNKYQLSDDRNYRYLRIPQDAKPNNRPRDNPKQNSKKYQKILEIFKEFGFSDDQIASLLNALAAILCLGEVRFQETSKDGAEIETQGAAIKVAQLLKIDEKKFIWTLTNYCIVDKETAVCRKHTCEEARDARDVLANTLYCRIVQYVINAINSKLSYGMAIFGEKYSIKVLDLYGFECFKENHFSQFLINCTNEQLQYYYLQRIFGWEALESNEENIPSKPFYYYNNKDALDELLGKDSVLSLIDDAAKRGKGGKYVIDHLQRQERVYINKINGSEFCINHYTGKVTYDTKEMPDRNRHFLPPEIIELLRCSDDDMIQIFFKSKLNKAGNLYMSFDGPAVQKNSSSTTDIFQQLQYSEQRFSQTKKMRTTASIFKAFSINLFKDLSVGGGAGGTHFVRCLRSDLQGNARGFHKEIVKQQLRAMAVVETTEARKRGFPHRTSFSEFLRRYKFLAFDFDENVEITKDNCRLLLVRLKMEGWIIGTTKVFLKYYNEEYLSRVYETQVKKVIKIQSMIRTYLARRRLLKKLKITKQAKKRERQDKDLTKEESAAIIVQKAYREYSGRKAYKRFSSEGDTFDAELIEFMRIFYNKWRSKTIFQVLLQYRAARYNDLYNLSQQVHLYNQKVMNVLQQCGNIDLERVDPRAQIDTWLGTKKPSVLKLPFRLDEVPYFDTSYMCDSLAPTETAADKDEESWDAPLRWRETVSAQITSSMFSSSEDSEVTNKPRTALIELPYSRNLEDPIQFLSSSPVADLDEEKQDELDESDSKETHDLSKSSRDDHLQRINNITTTPANNDFAYIRPPSATKFNKPRSAPVNPVVELEIKGRRQGVTSEDDPPFNFQAMLRKTNYTRDSIKRDVGENKISSLKGKLRTVENKDDHKAESTDKHDSRIRTDNFNSTSKMEKDDKPEKETKGGVPKEVKPTVTFRDVITSTEIAPGIFLEGVVVEL